MYSKEEILVQDFLNALSYSTFAKNGEILYLTEFNYQRGCTDIIALNSEGDVFAFEAKLFDWRGALHQAYRNKCFANYSYIVLPEETAKRASNYISEFEERSVGLCYLSGGEVTIVYTPEKNCPIQQYLFERASSSILCEYVQ